MKVTRMLLSAAVLVLALGIFMPAALHASEVTITIDGVQVEFEDQAPVVVDGRTLVPVRGVFEVLGFVVEWDQDTQTATLTDDNYVVAITVGEDDFVVNGNWIRPFGAFGETPVPAQLIGDRTMLPIRFVLESVGFGVAWDQDTQTISVLTELRTTASLEPNPYALENQMAPPEYGEEFAIIHTNHGEIHIRLFPQYAPMTVENFVTLARDGFYDGSIFHRIIPEFMIQGGAPAGSGGVGGESIWGVPFGDEFSHNLRHMRGALSMANAGPATNTSQFFIVNRMIQPEPHEIRIAGYFENPDTVSNRGRLASQIWPEGMIDWYLEHGGTYHLDFNHTVFGQVFYGQDLVDYLALVETGEADRPILDVIILRIEIAIFGE
ncbi:MAG: peptidylprolyl isomerase [Defluviitaleaceae bacterium]|nr:peptidylprolyl isomerase [Defluviitaleaceae bacterium]